MMHRPAFALVLVLAGLSARPACAQVDLFSFLYPVSFPTAALGDVIGKASWRGVGFEWRRFPSPKASFGLSLGWHVFDERTDAPIDLRRLGLAEGDLGGTISGEQFRYVNAFPVLLTGHYYLGLGSAVKPYVGLGVGTYYIIRRLDIGVASLKRDRLHLGFAPEVGFALPLGQSPLLGVVSGTYHYAFGTGGSIDFSYWGVRVGVAWSGY
jgi:hypothetical protein